MKIASTEYETREEEGEEEDVDEEGTRVSIARTTSCSSSCSLLPGHRRRSLTNSSHVPIPVPPPVTPLLYSNMQNNLCVAFQSSRGRHRWLSVGGGNKMNSYLVF